MSGVSERIFELSKQLKTIGDEVNLASDNLDKIQPKFTAATKRLQNAYASCEVLLTEIMAVLDTGVAPWLSMGVDAEMYRVLLKPIEQLGLKARPKNCLVFEGILYVGDLVQRTQRELLKIPNLGHKSRKEIVEVLASQGLTLGMNFRGFWPPQELKNNS